MKTIVVLASGTKDGGGSGLAQLISDILAGILDARIIGVVSNHPSGGVRQVAERAGVPFICSADPLIYSQVVGGLFGAKPDLVVMAGWLKLIEPRDVYDPPVVNIHPAPLPRFGGKGMYGIRPHAAVLVAGLDHSAVSIHFVPKDYDRGPSIFVCPVKAFPSDTILELQGRVNKVEHWCYGRVLERVLMGATIVSLEDLGQPPAEIAELIYTPAA